MNLTPEDVNNLIAFVNRSQISGQEAEVAVHLKQKLLAIAKEMMKEPSVENQETDEK